ncbi:MULTISPECIES: GTP-binding protein [Blautia]|uniref:GTP-binding protein n=2 Tax=Lachnospiraceae TaxID=186803 RepID=UPI001CD9AFFE|nr:MULTISPECIES: GTP-binding protein [Blautia]MCB4353652.1 GTP-binding protein [Blautia sp. RD014232]MCQ4870367.1 GTP-binding protein [Blautia producta]UBU20505.1 GTP-binding protein [Blautia parvula]
MTKIDIFSGFLGAGKTTLIKKLLKEAYKGEQVVLIENEFGEIGIDGGFLKEAGIEIREMNSGCICCSLVGDFGEALKEVIQKYEPDRIIIEPSGVGKLSDVIKAVKKVEGEVDIKLNSFTTLVDVMKCKMYMKNFGEFFSNQIEYAGTIILSRTDKAAEEKVIAALQIIRGLNKSAAVITTPIEKLSGAKILDTMENNRSLEKELLEEEVCPVCGGHHEHHHEEECGHEHHHGEECGHEHHHGEECGHEHHHGEECGHEHHHGEECDHDHHHGEECSHDHHHGEECGHEHHHEEECDHDHHHTESCGCGHTHDHHDHDHHHHHADEVFTSWGRETAKTYTEEEIHAILEALSDDEEYGMILRAKGMVEGKNGSWIYFDMVPGEADVREGSPEYTGRICVIGSKLKESSLEKLFKLA